MDNMELVDLINTMQDHLNDLKIESDLILKRNNKDEFDRFLIVCDKRTMLAKKRNEKLEILKDLTR